MIHQYKNNGYNIVLDVESGSVHVVDDLCYDVIALYEENDKDQIVDKLKVRYKESDIREAITEIEELKEAGQLFTEDIYRDKIDFKKRKTVVKALCLHIAHDCNTKHSWLCYNRPNGREIKKCIKIKYNKSLS